MAGSSRSGTAWKSAYTSYKATDRCAKNKARKLAKHQAAHPSDNQAKDCKLAYTRKAPKNKGGWVTGRVFADFGSYLRIEKDDKNNNVSRSRAVQKRIAQHASFDAAVRRESVYTQRKNKQAKPVK